MPALDKFHEVVKRALEKEGWKITNDPLPLKLGDLHLHVDLGAEKVIGAERNGDKIAVEIKTLSGGSVVSEFQKTIGQISMYQESLRENDFDRKLYLAISQNIYGNLLKQLYFTIMVKVHSIRLLIFDHNKEEIVKWIE